MHRSRRWTVASVSGMPADEDCMRRVAVVVPCFNEERRLDVSAFVNARLDAKPGDAERDLALDLVFVDDGSTDGTRGVLDEIRRRRGAPVTIVARTVNGGKAEAVRDGVRAALATSPFAVGFWDADLATPLSEVDAFVDVLERQPSVELVVGSRVMLMGRTIERRAWRHYLGRVFATAASVALALPVYDTQCGAKLFRVTPALARVFDEPFLTRWVFDVEILARFLAVDPARRAETERSIYELPLRTWVDVRGSKVKPWDFPRAAFDLGRIRLKYPRVRPTAPASRP